MGMPVHQLAGQAIQNFVDRERALVLRHLGIEQNLEQQIAQLARKFFPIAIVDGFQNFVGFLKGVGLDRIEGLFAVPRASARTAQPGHDRNRAFETFSSSGHEAQTL